MYPLGTPYLMWVGTHFSYTNADFYLVPLWANVVNGSPSIDLFRFQWKTKRLGFETTSHTKSTVSIIATPTTRGSPNPQIGESERKKNLLMHVLRDEKINITFDITYFLKKCVMHLILKKYEIFSKCIWCISYFLKKVWEASGVCTYFIRALSYK